MHTQASTPVISPSTRLCRRRSMQAQSGRGRGMQGLLHTQAALRSHTSCLFALHTSFTSVSGPILSPTRPPPPPPVPPRCFQHLWPGIRTQDKVYITHGSLAYIHTLHGLLKTLHLKHLHTTQELLTAISARHSKYYTYIPHSRGTDYTASTTLRLHNKRFTGQSFT